MIKRALMLSAATAALFSCPSLADTNVTSQLTSPIDTATDGNITIDSDGSVVITTSPPVAAAVTIDSTAGDVVTNAGTISYNGVGSATAVKLETGYSGELVSAAKIEVTGTGSSKTAILISGIPSDPNSGTFTGVSTVAGTEPIAINLESGSTTQVTGDDSIGISQLSGTSLVGNIDIDGSLSILPTSGTSTKTSIGNVIAINLAGNVTGNVFIESAGVVTASGNGAEGLQSLGTVTGSIINEGTLQTYGTANATTVNTSTTNRPQASSALGIGGSVLSGIYNGGPSTVSDTSTVRAVLSTAGSEPTIIINPALGNSAPSANLVVGIYSDPTDPGNSFLNRGTITGSSENPNVDVTTFSIIGANDTTAKTIFEGGLFNGGTITSSAYTNTRASSVTANTLYIGNYAFIPSLTNSNESGSGTISASISGPESGTATAILISQYGSLGSINNTGTISSSATTTNPDLVTSLTSYAILDESGTLSSITNSGTISATATTLKNNAQTAVAVDLSVSSQELCNCTGVTFMNTGTVTGAIEFGSGNDTLTDIGTAQTGAIINGNVSFGGTTGGDDTLTIGDFGTLTGAVIEQLGSHVDVTVEEGGTLNLENTPTNLGSNVIGLYAGTFEVDSGANLGLVVSQPFNLTVNPQTGALIQAAESASIGNDTNFRISFGSYIGNYLPGKGNQGNDQTASFDLLSAPKGDLAISGSELNLINTDFATSIPFLFTGDLCTWNVNGRSTCDGANPGISELVLNLTPKSAQDLGLKGYALQMFPYVNESLASDDTLGAAMLNDIGNAQEAQSAYAAYAPDVSGATRALAISLTDGATDVVADRQRALREYANQDGDLTMWTQEFVERLNQDNTSVGNGYTDSGFGFVLGADEGDPLGGRYGGAFTFFSGGMDAKAPLIQKTNSEWYMATGYTDWRGKIFFLDTQATVGYAHLNGTRSLDLDGFSRTATDSRPAEYLAGGATAGLQYDVAGAAVMPQLSLDGLAMRQEGYTETGNEGGQTGSNGFDLHIEPDYAASVRGFAGVDSRGDINLGDFLLQPEARAGYRYDFANGQESVTANFVDVTPIDQFKISGPKPAAGNALAGGGVALSTGAWSIGLSFDYLYANSGNTSEEGTLTLLGRI